MGRRFLPALRSGAVDLPPEGPFRSPERKDLLSDMGSEFVSVIRSDSGVSRSYGVEDRAAGWDLDAVIRDGYERVVWVHRAVETIAGHASRLPFRIGRDIDGDDEEILEDHELYRVLNRRANPHETGRQFRKRLVAQVLLSKRGAFVEVQKSKAGRVTRLDLLPPNRVRPIPDDDTQTYVKHFEFTPYNGEVREIPPENIRWVRDPHPTDPFCGVTPLEAAGMPVELAHLALTYQVNFLKNDGRPSGVLGIDADGMDDDELDRMARRVEIGPRNAGKLAIVGTGPGGLTYQDMSATPRDMAYGEQIQSAKDLILAAFGVPESILGNAADRTYANASQELYNFWSERMLPLLEMVASAFEPDIDEDFDGFFDTSTVEALEVPKQDARDKALAEFQAGLRSIDEYRPLVGLDPLDTPQTRALWIAPNKAPIAANKADAAALGVGASTPGAGGAPDDGSGTPAADAVAAARAQGNPGDGDTAAGAVAQARAIATGGDGTAAADTVTQARGMAQDAGPGAAAEAVDQARLERKALDATTGTAAYSPDPDQQHQLALQIENALQPVLAKQQQVIAARLQSPKTRKGTPAWQPEYENDTRSGQQPIDTDRVVDADRWVQEVTDAVTPVLATGAAAAGAALLGGFALAGVLTPALSPIGFGAAAGRATVGAVLEAATIAGEMMRSWCGSIASRLAKEPIAAGSVDPLVALTHAMYDGHGSQLATAIAGQVAQAITEAAMEATAATLHAPLPGTPGAPARSGSPLVVREWVTRGDELVRPTHRAVDGTVEAVGVPFLVGGAHLRYPGDPLAPAAETIGCRCRLSYRAAPGMNLLIDLARSVAA